MPRFAANLSMFCAELPFLERFGAATRDAFEAVEFLFPYAFDVARIKAELDERMEGELATTLELHLARIGHVEVTNNPDRHEPGTGDINFSHLFRHLDRIGYRGWVGCEYQPAAQTQPGLGWRHALACKD